MNWFCALRRYLLSLSADPIKSGCTFFSWTRMKCQGAPYLLDVILLPRRLRRWLRSRPIALLLFLLAGLTSGKGSSPETLVLPRITEPPTIGDFLEMKPSPRMRDRLARVEGFLQREPRDGVPSAQETQVYSAYDDDHLYVIFICFDSEADKIRARMTRREKFQGDDWVLVSMDTFRDKLRAYELSANPLGIQRDSRYVEGVGFDPAFDTLWESKGRLTEKGYIVWMAIPFRSLRFSPSKKQVWGIAFWRYIPRINEMSSWPLVSANVEGDLNQYATLKGLEGISPGRNLQFIPYGFFRSFRTLDRTSSSQQRFVSDLGEIDGGLDAKLVFQDSLALDLALNPDFSQVESDLPQVTVNRRFEVFFPERRPFFQENSSFFQTPINLFFSRRIQDPRLGARLTGKKGRWAVGALLADDEAPGKSVPESDPLFGSRARFAVLRVNRDILSESTLGMIYTERNLHMGFNRVGGADARFKLNRNWVFSGQAVASSTRSPEGSEQAGPAYEAHLLRRGWNWLYSLDYSDRSPGFRTETGFLPGRRVRRLLFSGRPIERPSLRPDVRSLSHHVDYRFRREGQHFLSWGPTFLANPIWDHHQNRLHRFYDIGLGWEFSGETHVELFHAGDRELLRPGDLPTQVRTQEFSHHRSGLYLSTNHLSWVSLKTEYSVGTGINLLPAEDQDPELVGLTQADLTLTLRPSNSLRSENAYLLERLLDRSSAASVFNNHILRSRWDWQLNHKLSLRFILQYETVLSNPDLTLLETSKNLNGDFLLTYLVNPWTALYVGYNDNHRDLDLLEGELSRSGRNRRFLNDSRQFFVKLSYLLTL